jgi:hypothetical protein
MRARQGDRRLVLDQRHDLFARPSRRLRPLGRGRPADLVLRPRAAVFPQAGDLGGRRQRPPRRRRPARHLLVDVQGHAGRRLYRGEPRDRTALERRPQQLAQRRHRPQPEHHPRRPPLQRLGGLSAAGDGAQESHGRNQRAGDARRARRRPGRRRRIPPGQCGASGARPTRGAARRRRDQSRRRFRCAASAATCRTTSR